MAKNKPKLSKGQVISMSFKKIKENALGLTIILSILILLPNIISFTVENNIIETYSFDDITNYQKIASLVLTWISFNFIYSIINIFLMNIAILAIVYLINQSGANNWKNAFNLVGKKIIDIIVLTLALYGLGILIAICIIITAILLILLLGKAGIVISCVLTIVMLVMAGIYFSFIIQAMGIKDLGVKESLKSSYQIVKGRFCNVLVKLFLLVLISLVISVVVLCTIGFIPKLLGLAKTLAVIGTFYVQIGKTIMFKDYEEVDTIDINNIDINNIEFQ